VVLIWFGEIVCNTVWIFSKIWCPVRPNSELYATWLVCSIATPKSLRWGSTWTVIVRCTSWDNFVHNPDFWSFTVGSSWQCAHVKPECRITFPCTFEIIDCTQYCLIALHYSKLGGELSFNWFHLPKHSCTDLTRCDKRKLISEFSFELFDSDINKRVHKSLEIYVCFPIETSYHIWFEINLPNVMWINFDSLVYIPCPTCLKHWFLEKPTERVVFVSSLGDCFFE